jgi:hypothetical protein
VALTPEETAELREGILETLDWLTFYDGWLAGYKAGGGDTNDLDAMRPNAETWAAYREHVAARSKS